MEVIRAKRLQSEHEHAVNCKLFTVKRFHGFHGFISQRDTFPMK